MVSRDVTSRQLQVVLVRLKLLPYCSPYKLSLHYESFCWDRSKYVAAREAY